MTASNLGSNPRSIRKFTQLTTAPLGGAGLAWSPHPNTGYRTRACPESVRQENLKIADHRVDQNGRHAPKVRPRCTTSRRSRIPRAETGFDLLLHVFDLLGHVRPANERGVGGVDHDQIAASDRGDQVLDDFEAAQAIPRLVEQAPLGRRRIAIGIMRAGFRERGPGSHVQPPQPHMGMAATRTAGSRDAGSITAKSMLIFLSPG